MRVIGLDSSGLPAARQTAYKLCINCGYCVDVCAWGALKHRAASVVQFGSGAPAAQKNQGQLEKAGSFEKAGSLREVIAFSFAPSGLATAKSISRGLSTTRITLFTPTWHLKHFFAQKAIPTKCWPKCTAPKFVTGNRHLISWRALLRGFAGGRHQPDSDRLPKHHADI